MQTAGDATGFITPSASGPVRTMRGPYRAIAILTTVLMLAGGFALLPVTTAAQEEQDVETLTVTAGLNLRSAPSLEAEVFAVMPAGTEIEILEEPVNSFYHVDHDGQVGWAHEDYLAEPSAVAGAAAPAMPAVNGVDGYSPDELVQIIYAAADMYGQPRADLLRVARCESVLDPYAVNASSNASGLFQFLPSTWATTPYAGQDIFDPVANAEAAAWMWSQGRRGEWVCQ